MDLSTPLPMALPRRRWMWLNACTPAATVGDLATALAPWGVRLDDRQGVVRCDGEPVEVGRRLVHLGLRAGSTWEPGATRLVPPWEPGVVEVSVVGGAEAGGAARLPAGLHVVGRAHGLRVTVPCAGVVPHAVVVEVEGTAERPQVWVTHVAGEVPRLGERPVTDRTPWPHTTLLRIGSAQVQWRPASPGTAGEPPGVVDPPHEAPWRVLHRRGRPAREPPSPPDASPAPSPVGGPPLAPSAVAAATSLIVAAVMRQPLLAFMGVTSLLATGAWWTVVRLRHGRRMRRHERGRRRADAQGAAQSRLESVPLHTLALMARGQAAGLWERRPPRHHDVWHVTVGYGARCQPDGTWWHDVPVQVDLGPRARVGLAGGSAVALARALMAQLVTQVGPADLAVQVVTAHDAHDVSDLTVLPHTQVQSAHRVLLLLLPLPDGWVPGEADVDAAWLVVDDRCQGDHVEAWCATVVRWDGVESQVDVVERGRVTGHVAPAGVSTAWLHELVRALVMWRDPEIVRSPGVGPPMGIPATSWAELHAARTDDRPLEPPWEVSGDGLPAVLGYDVRGETVVIDLVRHGPHALLAGTTGSGKSEALRTLVLGWAWCTPPDRLQFVLIDYKGGAAFDACTRLPHVVGVVTDLDGELSGRVLAGLRAELTHRERVLRSAGVSDLAAWRGQRGGMVPLPRLVIVVDEVAALVEEHPEVVTALVALAQRGRSLGVHLVLATQRPAGVVRDDVRANTDVRICLRVADRVDAVDVVGDPRPAAFDRRRPGRALVRNGADDAVEVQVADTACPWDAPVPPVQVSLVGAPTPPLSPTGVVCSSPSTLTVVVETLAEAARRRGEVTRHRVWAPPLPPVLTATPDPTDVGVLDDVGHRRWLPLRCDDAGHAVVVGAPGSGVSTTLQRILATRPHHEVVALADTEPCAPQMERLLATLDERRRWHRQWHPLTIVIDGVGAFRRRWEQELGSGAWQITAWWERLLDEGPTVGIVVLAGADRVASCGTALVSVASTRWLLRPLDPLDAAHLGVRWPHGGGVATPPGRLVDASTGLVGQVAFSTPSTMCTVRSA